MLETLLKEHGGELLSSLTGGTGLDTSQAESLLPPALSGIGEALSGGGFDLGALLGGGGQTGVSDLLGKLDIGQIAGAAGLDEGQTKNGLASLIPAVLGLLGNQAGGVDGLMSMLGGGDAKSGALGALGGIAGKLFGK